jgi:hypothetical protein
MGLRFCKASMPQDHARTLCSTFFDRVRVMGMRPYLASRANFEKTEDYDLWDGEVAIWLHVLKEHHLLFVNASFDDHFRRHLREAYCTCQASL